MEIKQYYLGCLSHASYMITDEKSRTAVVVDPQRDVDQYVRDAEAAGVRISDVVLTPLKLPRHCRRSCPTRCRFNSFCSGSLARP